MTKSGPRIDRILLFVTISSQVPVCPAHGQIRFHDLLPGQFAYAPVQSTICSSIFI